MPDLLVLPIALVVLGLLVLPARGDGEAHRPAAALALYDMRTVRPEEERDDERRLLILLLLLLLLFVVVIFGCLWMMAVAGPVVRCLQGRQARINQPQLWVPLYLLPGCCR